MMTGINHEFTLATQDFERAMHPAQPLDEQAVTVMATALEDLYKANSEDEAMATDWSHNTWPNRMKVNLAELQFRTTVTSELRRMTEENAPQGQHRPCRPGSYHRWRTALEESIKPGMSHLAQNCRECGDFRDIYFREWGETTHPMHIAKQARRQAP